MILGDIRRPTSDWALRESPRTPTKTVLLATTVVSWSAAAVLFVLWLTAINIGEDSLLAAVNEGDGEMIRAVVQSGVDVNGKGGSGPLPLVCAIDKGRSEVAALLIDLGADVNARLSDGSSVLEYAVAHGSAESVRLLLARGASVRGPAGPRCAVYDATVKGDLEKIGLLVEAGADVDARNDVECTALMIASRRGNIAAVRLLISIGADVNTTDRYKRGGPAVYQIVYAPKATRKELLRILLTAGAKIDMPNAFGRTALMAAVEEGELDAVRLLIANGASLKARDPMGRTARDLAQVKSDPLILAALIEAGQAAVGGSH